jgi:hypothetical protein
MGGTPTQINENIGGQQSKQPPIQRISQKPLWFYSWDPLNRWLLFIGWAICRNVSDLSSLYLTTTVM